MVPEQRIILAESLAALGHADGAVEAAFFFHAQHRFIIGVADLIAHLGLFHHQHLRRTRTGTEEQGCEKAGDGLHGRNSSTLATGFKQQPTGRDISSCAPRGM
jgi:hypothetical protein